LRSYPAERQKMGSMKMDIRQESQRKTVQERIAEEDLIRERVDEEGNRWRKVYVGGGEHCRNWLEQFKELGEVLVEELDSKGFKCFEEGGERLCRVWLKIDETRMDDLL
jgi:hypothetical protein